MTALVGSPPGRARSAEAGGVLLDTATDAPHAVAVSVVRAEKLNLHRDPRGWVFEPVGPDDLPRQRNVHAVLTLPGAVRGNHYHERGTEFLIVVGPALVRLREGEQTRDQTIPDGEAWRFVIPPGVPHAIRNTGEAPIFMFGFNSVAHDPAAPDTKPCLLIPPP
ncbi:MAG: cupin domain-containing protein [Verrucomicrobiales bacterium]|nr:cupin domain-containing protein [Verrucomicrobiales bacterium]